MSRWITLAFFLSGISGLVYQVVWVKWFARIFGNTVTSASLVVSVFMCGLGLGSYFVGRWADRHATDARRPLQLYGGAEVAIAICGGLLALLLPAMEPLAAAISSYQVDNAGWHILTVGSYLVRLVLAVLVLAPPTLLMGGTLTLLIRYVLHNNLNQSAWRIGVLYGFNTLGAAAGAFLSDFALIPNLGLSASQGVAVVLNLAAATIALRLAQRLPPHASPAGSRNMARNDSAVRTQSTPHHPAQASPPSLAGLGGALVLSGAAAMGLEILWVRVLGIVLGGYQVVFSLLLATMLTAMWAGSLAGGALDRRFRRPVAAYMATQGVLALAAVGLLLRLTPEVVRGNLASLVAGLEGGQLEALPRIWHTLVNLRHIAALTALPAFLMGFAFPLANGAIQRVESEVGRRAGGLYLANTLGGVFGSAATGFLLLPAIGMQATVTVLLVLWGLSLGALVLAGPVRRNLWPALASGLLLATAAAWWLAQPSGLMAQRAAPTRADERVLVLSEGVNETIAVTEDADGNRKLNTNGHSMSGNSRWGQRYMRAFSHVPLLHLDDPKRAVVICFGVGSTLHAASLDERLRELHLVDISRHVLEHGHYFEATNHGVLHDPRLQLFVNDGRLHLWMMPEGYYDLVTLEPPPISYAGVSALYTRDFFRLVRSRLADGGFFTHWLPGYQVPGEVVRAMVRAFVDVFPNAILLSGAGPELILVGSKSDGPIVLDPDRFRARLAAHPALRQDLERVHLATLEDLVGCYAAGPETLAAATAESPAVTDDYPIMEYGIQSQLFVTRMPPELFDNRSVAGWCPACFDEHGRPVAELPHLAGTLAAMQAYFHSPRFLVYRNYGGPPPPVALPATQEVRDALAASPFLRAFFGGERTER